MSGNRKQDQHKERYGGGSVQGKQCALLIWPSVRGVERSEIQERKGRLGPDHKNLNS